MRPTTLAAFLAALATSGTCVADLVVDFDSASKWSAGSGSIGSYQSDHVYSDLGLTFTGGPALRQGNSSQDGHPGALGTYSWRLRNQPAEWTATYESVQSNYETINGFSFDVRRWDASPSPSWTVAYSFDSGTSFNSAGTIDNSLLDDSSDWSLFSVSFADTTVDDGDFVVQVTRGDGERIMIDNFTLAAVPEPTAFLFGSLVAGSVGMVVARRRPARKPLTDAA